MNNCTIPEKYRPLLGLYDTQVAIAMTKRVFEDTLSGAAAAGCRHGTQR